MADRKVGKRSLVQRGLSKAESGTCNVCSAPCSSCMHHNVDFVGSKSDESSDENCSVVVGSQCSVNEDGLLPSSKVNARNTNNTASEASNLVNSSHDAVPEYAESKETIRCSGVSDDSGTAAMSSKKYFSRRKMNRKVNASANVLENSNCIEGEEDGIISDDLTKKLNPGYRNSKIISRDPADVSALASDPILDRSMEVQDSTISKNSNTLPNEGESQSLHNPLSNHDDKISSERGNTKENLGPGGNKERDESSVERSASSVQNGKDEKLSKAYMSESENDESEMVEHDVKVCDICGDAGREDLLAICSRCSDGAEHIYCMRERLTEVPEGDWLCEECSEETEKLKQDANVKRETDINLNTQTLGKRPADKMEAAPDAKRQAAEGSIGSPKKSRIARIGSLSRETSFKGLDKSRGMLNHQTSFSDDTEGAESTGSQLHPPKGALLKSSSFNCSSSKQRVQLMDDVTLARQKTGKEHTLDTKEGGLTYVGKSMPSRITEAGSSTGNDSQARLLASRVSNQQEGKSSKQLKDRTEVNLPTSSTDKKLTSHGNSSSSYANHFRDLKSLQSDGKRGSLTKQFSNRNRNRVENPIASGGDCSTDEKSSPSKQSSSQANCKDELPTTSCQGEDMPSHGNLASQDGLPRSMESREGGKKSKEALGKRLRSSLLSGAKGLPSSQKGGQTVESKDTSGVSDSDLSTTKNVREDINKGNRLRAAVDAALRKKPSFGKNKGLEQSDASLVSNVDTSSDKTLRNQLPSNMHKNYVSYEGLQGGHSTLWPVSDPYKQTTVTNEKQFALPGPNMMPARHVEREVSFPSVKPIMRDWPLVGPPARLRSSAIPDHESIWQGDLEVRNTRNQVTMHGGIQAHLSTLASPKVAEVANKFPETFSLNEVPRLSTWPAPFQDIGTKEDHIALFFFAKDVESYERNYKPLVDNMIKKDLALKGNLHNVELLIFASNQLPPNCQRWNMLYFLWGVFRGRKEISTNPQADTSLAASIVSPRDREPSDLCQSSSPSKHLDKASSIREQSSNLIATQNKTGGFNLEIPSGGESTAEKSSSTKEEIALKEDEQRANHIPCQVTGLSSGDSVVDKVQRIEEQQGLGGRKDLPLTVMGSGIQYSGQNISLENDLNCSQASYRKRSLWELTRPTTENSTVMNEGAKNDSGLCGGYANKKLKTENESSSPKVVFPVDLNEERGDMEMEDSFIPLGNCSDNISNNNNKGLIGGTVPDLELALGAEETSQDNNNTIGLLPFLAERRNFGEESSNSMIRKEEEEEEEEEEDVAASLSLSLSFPGEERKKNVNTPLFLFRDLPK